jgi:hypothetical protein
MPDRIIREELLDSERWLTLKDNADRLAYIALVLKADDYGNFSAEPFRLMRMWREFGITTTELVAKTLNELADHELIGLYRVENKPLLHIPRFKNMRRYWSRKFPKSPFGEQTQIESNQSVSDKPAADMPQNSSRPAEGVGVGVGVKTLKPSRTDVRNDVDYPGDFKVFWAAYPRKVSKGQALKAWLKAKPDAELLARILQSIKNTQWSTDPTYIKHPATWISARCWEDELQDLGYNPAVLAKLRREYGPLVKPVEGGKFYDPGRQVRFSPEGEMFVPI